VATSILTSVKKVLGIDEDYTAFDPDIIMHINTAFATLNQLGPGPVDGFMIEDKTATWDDFYTDVNLNGVQTYVYLRVRQLFDPPQTGYLSDAMQKQIDELAWRINTVWEGTGWMPTPTP
jgi:hypothetical protein